MDFRILGPLEGSSGSAPLNLGGPRQRALLTYLLLHANEAVPADRLLADLWWDPPQGGTAALQTQISRLRKVVGERLESTPAGYLLRVERDELDLYRFRALLAEAGAAADATDRARLLREAEELWRGEPLAEADLPFVAGERAALDELRAGAIEDRLAADLDAGRGGAVIPELSALIARYPLRERLRGLLMLALYRSGRQAEALEVARETRRILDEELGLEPSPALRELERAILQQDPSLAALPASPPVAVSATPAHRRRPVLVAAALALSVAGAALSATVAWRQLHPAHASAVPAASRLHRRAAARQRARAHHATAARTTPTHGAVQDYVRRHVVRVSHSTAVAGTTVSVESKQVTPSAPTHRTAVKATTQKKKAAPTTSTATQPSKRTATQPSKPALQPDLVTVSDDFSGSSTNYAIWGVANDGTGGTASQGDGRLDLALPATGATGGRYNQISIQYFTQCRFGSDFDARVAYTLLDWPTDSGARLQLSAWIFPDTNSDAARSSSASGEQYDGDVASTWASIPTSDQQGMLRVARRGSVLTSYTQKNGKWIALKSGTARGQVTLGLQLFATSSDWSHQAVSAAFDNFTVTGQRPTCS